MNIHHFHTCEVCRKTHRSHTSITHHAPGAEQVGRIAAQGAAGMRQPATVSTPSNTRRAASRITHSRFCLIFEPEAFAEAGQHARGELPQSEQAAWQGGHVAGLVNHESGRRTLPARRKSVAWRTVLWTCSLLICIWRAFAHRASCTHHFWNMATTWRAKGSRIAL